MRRIILVTLVGVLIFFGYMCVVNGIENDFLDVTIYSLEDIKGESEKMSKELAAYNDLNKDGYKNSKDSIDVAIKKYEKTKAEYNELVEALNLKNEDSEEGLETTKKAYQIDFLFTIIGNYARSENSPQNDLNLELVFVESSATAPAKSGFKYANLKFDVQGNYMKIADFIYDLEDDDRLGYEIRDFYMKEGHATFTVYNVPIESSTLSNATVENSSGSVNNSYPSTNTGTPGTNGNTVTTPGNNVSNTTNTINNANLVN